MQTMPLTESQQLQVVDAVKELLKQPGVRVRWASSVTFPIQGDELPEGAEITIRVEPDR